MTPARALVIGAIVMPIMIVFALAAIQRPSPRAELWTEVLSGRFVPDETVIESCAELPGERIKRCYAQAFGNIAYREGAGTAMRLLLDLSGRSRGALSDCHLIAHMIGAASYSGLGGDFTKAISAGDWGCVGGYYHGVVAAETATVDYEGPEAFGERIAALCLAASEERSVRIECYHGIGHVAEHLYDYETPTALRSCEAMRTALSGSDPLGEAGAYHSCTQGVFMEARQAEGGQSGRWWHPGDPTYPCLEFDEETAFSCWELVPGSVEAADGESAYQLAARRFKVCNEATFQSWLDRCRFHARRAILVDPVDAGEIGRICELDPDGAAVCFRAIGEESIVRWASGERAESFCRGAATPEGSANCGFGIGEGLSTAGLGDTICGTLTSPLVESCRAGYAERERRAE
jgi:hypothetical protein